MPIQKAPPLREQVVDALVRELRSGSLQPGVRLTEMAIAERFDVSRTPAREALNQLVEQGLLEARPRGGYLVPSPTLAGIQDIIGVRMLIEPPAIAVLAASHGPEDLRRIDDAIAAEWAAVDSATPAFAQANEGFRSSLFDRLENRLHRDMIAQFAGHLDLVRVITLDDLQLRRRILALQSLVRDRIAAADPAAASRAWEEYLEFTRISLIAAVERIGA